MPVNPFRSVIRSEFLDIYGHFQAVNLDTFLSTDTYSKYSPDLTRVFCASLQHNAEHILIGNIGTLVISLHAQTLLEILEIPHTGPSLLVL